jgi:DNA-binding transcriptional MerR regulator
MYSDDKNDMKKGLYSIGEISEATGLSVTTIRYYSDRGLIVPSYIDESTGYRYFSSRHVWKLEIIKMYRQLGFSLNEIIELQRTKQLNVLEQIIDENKQSVQEKIEEYNIMLTNLNWLRDQCNIFRQSKAEDGIMIRKIPQRKILYMDAKSKSDKLDFAMFHCDAGIWDFKMLNQKKIAKELEKHKTIERCYGFKLNNDFFEQGKLKIEGEYIKLSTYYSYGEKELKILPEGNYLCLIKNFVDWTKEAWMQKIFDKVKMMKIKPDIILLEEVSLYLLSLEDTYFELQIRIPE